MQEAILQLALKRAGVTSISELLGGASEAAAPEVLMPYLVGYQLWRVQPGDTYGAIAARFGTTVRAIETANPGVSPDRLPVGRLLVVPLGFDLVPEDTPMTSELMHYVIRGLQVRYPMLQAAEIGKTAYGRPLEQLRVGDGPRLVYYNASHHANEWITSSLVLRCLEAYLRAGAFGETLLGLDIRAIQRETTLYLVPMVNPDGVDLVTGNTTEQEREAAQKIGENFPEIPFPSGWKANLRGVDLNLNYPARWDQAREIKYEKGFDIPAPRDYVGPEPLSESESRAMFDTTEELDPDVVVAWHTQGQEIYWKFLDLEPQGARLLGEQMALASGYSLEEVPYASSFAGYKDWFIQDFDRPGYTIEAGLGENPLPISQLPEIFRENLPMFLLGLTGAMAPDAVNAQTLAPGVQKKPPLPEHSGEHGMTAAWG
jgi:g-D-glutamyl-meso-diaminopimelate peptidase